MSASYTYDVVELNDPELLEKFPEYVDYYDDDEPRRAIVKRQHGFGTGPKGTIVEVLSLDGGEPEDNSFDRDGAWIAPALNEAYTAGYKLGYERGQPRDALDTE